MSFSTEQKIIIDRMVAGMNETLSAFYHVVYGSQPRDLLSSADLQDWLAENGKTSEDMAAMLEKKEDDFFAIRHPWLEFVGRDPVDPDVIVPIETEAELEPPPSHDMAAVEAPSDPPPSTT